VEGQVDLGIGLEVEGQLHLGVGAEVEGQTGPFRSRGGVTDKSN
jgi:hypothetical protein